MCVASAEASQERRHQTTEGNNRIPAESTEQQVEPHYIGLGCPYRIQQSENGCGVIERPATDHVEAFRLRMFMRKLVRKNCQIQEGIAAQFPGNVKPVFAQAPSTRRKSRDQTNFHSP